MSVNSPWKVNKTLYCILFNLICALRGTEVEVSNLCTYSNAYVEFHRIIRWFDDSKLL